MIKLKQLQNTKPAFTGFIILTIEMLNSILSPQTFWILACIYQRINTCLYYRCIFFVSNTKPFCAGGYNFNNTSSLFYKTISHCRYQKFSFRIVQVCIKKFLKLFFTQLNIRRSKAKKV